MFDTSDFLALAPFTQIKKMSLPSVIDGKNLSHLYLPFTIQEVLPYL